MHKYQIKNFLTDHAMRFFITKGVAHQNVNCGVFLPRVWLTLCPLFAAGVAHLFKLKK